MSAAQVVSLIFGSLVLGGLAAAFYMVIAKDLGHQEAARIFGGSIAVTAVVVAACGAIAYGFTGSLS